MKEGRLQVAYPGGQINRLHRASWNVKSAFISGNIYLLLVIIIPHANQSEIKQKYLNTLVIFSSTG